MDYIEQLGVAIFDEEDIDKTYNILLNIEDLTDNEEIIRFFQRVFSETNNPLKTQILQMMVNKTPNIEQFQDIVKESLHININNKDYNTFKVFIPLYRHNNDKLAAEAMYEKIFNHVTNTPDDENVFNIFKDFIHYVYKDLYKDTISNGIIPDVIVPENVNMDEEKKQEVIDKWLEQHLLEIRDFKGNSIPFDYLTQSRFKYLQYLVDSGFDVNVQDYRFSLLVPVYLDNPKDKNIIHYLIEKGIDLHRIYQTIHISKGMSSEKTVIAQKKSLSRYLKKEDLLEYRHYAEIFNEKKRLLNDMNNATVLTSTIKKNKNRI